MLKTINEINKITELALNTDRPDDISAIQESLEYLQKKTISLLSKGIENLNGSDLEDLRYTYGQMHKIVNINTQELN